MWWTAPIEHRVECRDFVHSHRRKFKKLRHIVHNAYARPSFVLALSKIKKRDDSRFLVLRGVVRNYFVSAFEILRCILEWNLRHGWN